MNKKSMTVTEDNLRWVNQVSLFMSQNLYSCSKENNQSVKNISVKNLNLFCWTSRNCKNYSWAQVVWWPTPMELRYKMNALVGRKSNILWSTLLWVPLIASVYSLINFASLREYVNCTSSTVNPRCLSPKIEWSSRLKQRYIPEIELLLLNYICASLKFSGTCGHDVANA